MIQNRRRTQGMNFCEMLARVTSRRSKQVDRGRELAGELGERQGAGQSPGTGTTTRFGEFRLEELSP